MLGQFLATVPRQRSTQLLRKRDDRCGDRIPDSLGSIADLPINAFIQPAGLPINTSTTEVLRRPVEFTVYRRCL
ncbi:hypothetical protein GCM10010174_45710 [Kutzneria viridogrisea]|uniref:Uncharacterized protein n=1 Tax=Kutzneria viridogrisea TaxID=47990 RepID=A0ABR6BA14_9PSEU|nr:hypothetical protein [Kutzneria albida]MBA8923702.1 hypothetical protein [Kutzneria viridogrisea]